VLQQGPARVAARARRGALERTTVVTDALPLTVPNSEAWCRPSQLAPAPRSAPVKLPCCARATG